MMYVTGGLAVGGVRNRWGYTDTFPALVYQFADDETRVGWTAGGGFEHRFTPNWSARIEGLYVDLGRSKTVAVTGAPGSGGTNFGTYRSRWENTAIVARAGLTYHWGP
jgi:outer membrane immunogenic protein